MTRLVTIAGHALGWAGLLLSVRGLTVVAFEIVFLTLYHYYYSEDELGWATISLAAAGWFAALVLSQYLRRRVLSPERTASRWGLGIALLLLSVLFFVTYEQRTSTAPLTTEFVSVREPGHFPYKRKLVEFTRNGYTGRAHIRADGFRQCEPGGGDSPGPGTVDIGLVGDSMVFGLTVPDDKSPCWMVRELLPHLTARGYAFHNLAQPGAALDSYEQTLRYVHRTWDLEGAVVGMLIPNDAQLIDVNDDRELVKARWLRFFATLLTSEVALTATRIYSKVWRPEMVVRESIRQGMEDLATAADELKLPTVWFLWDSPAHVHRRHGGLSEYVALATGIAARSSFVRFAGVLPEPDSPPGLPNRVPGDGHPTPAGMPAIAQWIADQVQSMVDDRLLPEGAE